LARVNFHAITEIKKDDDKVDYLKKLFGIM